MDGWAEDVMNPRQCLLELWKMPRSVESFFVFLGVIRIRYDKKRNEETSRSVVPNQFSSIGSAALMPGHENVMMCTSNSSFSPLHSQGGSIAKAKS